tara:strand:+ start:14190 stop:14351 length:162 start_codon:yes stop_codon:yes gene_type:complete
MPQQKKSKRERDANGRYTKEEVAVVSQLGVNDVPEPTEPVVKKTFNGNTITKS